MRYLLDTNICIYIAKRRPASVSSHLARLKQGDAGISVVTYLELVCGAWKSQRFEEDLARIEAFERLVPAQPLDADVARYYGKLRTDLERSGSIIGAHDLMIAAHALSLGVTLVTNNIREFSRVQDLRLENWAK
ncbi:MAG TPA: type II toxin-antitoxin system VapC family toxin [Terriglobia bacterium]|jgi:tRNA(fMet)-specific endonuclease VapC|nr:type II toxin-antitoxin system VapC family toxin [Terriglobia bacterium]